MSLPLLDAFWAVPIAALLPYVPHVFKIMAVVNKNGGSMKAYDLRTPRISTAKAIDESPAGKYISRCQAAHDNGFESFPFFAAAVVLARLTGVDKGTMDVAATLHIVSRILYNYLYITGESGIKARCRSLVWAVSLGTSFYLAGKAAWAASASS